MLLSLSVTPFWHDYMNGNYQHIQMKAGCLPIVNTVTVINGSRSGGSNRAGKCAFRSDKAYAYGKCHACCGAS